MKVLHFLKIAFLIVALPLFTYAGSFNTNEIAVGRPPIHRGPQMDRPMKAGQTEAERREIETRNLNKGVNPNAVINSGNSGNPVIVTPPQGQPVTPVPGYYPQ